MKNIQRTLILGCSLLALAGCGADEIVSPGTSGNIIINNPTPSPTPTPTPTPTQTLVTPAAGCPTINSTGGLTDSGTISGPTGTYRVCSLPPVINASDTLPFIQGLLYALPGRVDVGVDRGFASTGTTVTLTVQPGVIVFGSTGRSYLLVTRGNAIQANGTAARPIVWTSRDNVLGLADDSSIGQWGGVVLTGRAPVSDCASGGVNTTANPTNNPTCQQALEGEPVTVSFGGANSADTSGSFTFNQIRFSGFSLAPGNELQALTTGGIGSGTTITNFMSFNSSDDGAEFFGGSPRLRNVAIIGADDDSLDVDTGAQFDAQYVVVTQRSLGDNLIELDSPDGAATPIGALPQTVMRVSNFTFLERSTNNDQLVRARGGARLTLANGVMDTNTETCYRIDEALTFNAGANITSRSVVGDCDPAAPFNGSSGVTAAEVQADFTADATANSFAFAITLTGGFVNGTGENAVAAFNANTLSTFFETTTFIGTANDAAAATSRFGGWTCSSSIQTFTNSPNQCTRLPVYS